ncbi:hypothetical protein ACIBKY_51200 [Nonomuraea sp. NPDC050394]|uniref:hypothetical protein n=1 Tax=Nonomuraea sp. NPDC050394 TaxID=3364363 RepID=UPI0037981945
MTASGPSDVAAALAACARLIDQCTTAEAEPADVADLLGALHNVSIRIEPLLTGLNKLLFAIEAEGNLADGLGRDLAATLAGLDRELTSIGVDSRALAQRLGTAHARVFSFRIRSEK